MRRNCWIYTTYAYPSSQVQCHAKNTIINLTKPKMHPLCMAGKLAWAGWPSVDPQLPPKTERSTCRRRIWAGLDRLTRENIAAVDARLGGPRLSPDQTWSGPTADPGHPIASIKIATVLGIKFRVELYTLYPHSISQLSTFI